MFESVCRYVESPDTASKMVSSAECVHAINYRLFEMKSATGERGARRIQEMSCGLGTSQPDEGCSAVQCSERLGQRSHNTLCSRRLVDSRYEIDGICSRTGAAERKDQEDDRRQTVMKGREKGKRWRTEESSDEAYGVKAVESG